VKGATVRLDFSRSSGRGFTYVRRCYLTDPAGRELTRDQLNAALGRRGAGLLLQLLAPVLGWADRGTWSR
jgi:hypothetical protein